MNLNCDLSKIDVIEFGVSRDNENGGQQFDLIPVDKSVQKALISMACTTWDNMKNISDNPDRYEPSEKHEDTEYLYLPLNDKLASFFKQLYEADNLQINSEALNATDSIFLYFARLTDNAGNRIIAIRRSTQFKGVLKSRLIRFLSDALRLIEDHVFKLDIDFDLLIDSHNVFILRPSGFEFTGKLQSEILSAVSQNITSIEKELPYVVFTNIEEYAKQRPRAARYLASIRSSGWDKNINKVALKKWCKKAGIKTKESQGQMEVEPGCEIGFLELLDRRLYELDLVKGPPERFKASSRKKI